MASRRPSRFIFIAAASLFAIFAIAAGVLEGPAFAIPIVILAVLVLGFLAANTLLAKRTMQRHDGDSAAAQRDGSDDVPSAHLIPDERPLGDTAQAHDEISPHDLPKDSPGRRAAEALAAGNDNGTTRGHKGGATGGTALAQDEEKDGAEVDR